jgi:protein-disulfide isomerase
MANTDCPICEDCFPGEGSVRDHAWEAHGACHHCGDRFEERESLYAHWLAVHAEDLSRTDRKRAEAETGGLTIRDHLAHRGPAEYVAETATSRRGVLGLSGAALLAIVGGAFTAGMFWTDRGDEDTLDGHPSALGFRSQPTYGPSASNAEGTIVAFEDPSSPACARFERDVFPKIKERLLDAGTVSFVFRNVPMARPWGDAACLALEATYARDEDAFRALTDQYFQSQSRFDDENVLDETRRFLAEETEVDASEVISDVEEEAHRDAIDIDMRASQDAGVEETPTFYLFRDGEFVTELVGEQSVETFESALDV